ncbi:SRPBCC family protein [Corynebacterium lubricantis]|uniref:SRPBCC family protein n=1 Tax=Corynebacterium lubricantis TaxID=541095 RepID=UPI000526B619|nr:SRPBCC family protein [Corynebacterium lubricantis]
MIRIDKTVTIRRPAHEVFAFVADLTNGPLWQDDLKSAVRVGDQPLGIGTVHEFTRVIAGRTFTSKSTFVEYEEGIHVRFVIDDRPASGWASYTVTEKSPGITELRSQLELSLSGPMRVLQPIMRRSILRGNEREFAALKELLEAMNN